MSERGEGKKKDNSSKSGKAARRLAEKRLRALQRQEAYDKLTNAERLRRLDTRPGESRRERERLLAKGDA